MANGDAEDKFFEAVGAFQVADEKARGGGLSQIDAKVFRGLIIDFDAAIPGLSNENRGRALLLKATCFYYLYRKGLREKKSIRDVVNLPPDPFLAEGLPYALEGRQILQQNNLVNELPWANDIVEKLEG